MKIYIINHNFHYEIENLTRVFFPNEKIEIIKDNSLNEFDYPCIVTRIDDNKNGKTVFVEIRFKNNNENCTTFVKSKNSAEDYIAEQEREMAICLYKLLTAYTGITPPWGILTGVRPIKLFRKLTEQYDIDYAKNYFKDSLLVTDEKITLAEETENNERAILSLSSYNSYSLYISIPFCPSRCSYCSFVSQSVEKAKKLIEPYIELLCQELKYTAKIAADLNLKLETVYIGGGTPTTLNAQQLEKLIYVINHNFPMEQCKEFTVEAGRPDTVTEDKLGILMAGGVNRISINPQTMNDDILEEIGRKHTAKQTIDAFNMARKTGFNHINMDLIVGLPNENFESFKNTLEIITKLNPESITVHTLSMKRSAYLTSQGMHLLKHDSEQAAKMHTYCRQLLANQGLRPYYLYRQSRMVGNLENIGYAKNGYDGLYNVYVMDETHTILGCGAGAVTKLKDPKTGILQRIFNYKYPYEYNTSFEVMIKRKDGINKFYKEYFDK